ncbi:MAG: SpaH/EbpB family LPXTG-anchored major pilin [Clostridia bacterium]|nr:SpaH/EbpB family LPXTG-anchored major pilin [Clostridia bacterium]
MKKANKIFSLLLAVAVVFAMAIPAFAADWTGSITIEGTTAVSVDGKTFNAYQILEANAIDEDDLDAGVVYSIPAAMQSFYNELCAKADGENATIDEVIDYIEGSADLQAFAAEALQAAKDAGIAPASVTGGEDNKATFENLAFGYYVIEDDATTTPVSALMLRTTSETVTIKADKPAIEKKIDGDEDKDNSTLGLVDYNTATVGEEVPYVITSKVPDMTGYDSYTFVVTDTFSAGLTFNNDIAITIGEELEADVDYTVEIDGQKVTITFVDFIQYAKNTDIVITYSATVNENAVIGTEGNPNAVNLTYSNNPQITESKETTPDDVVYTYLADLVINKTGNDDQPLEGAVFSVLHNDEVIATGTSDEYGKVIFTWVNGVGLKDGETYTIHEDMAPAGYNEADDITFKVICTDPTAPETACTWSVENDENVSYSEDDEYFVTTIKNLTGSLLPETGGIGTTIFYIVGALFVIGAIVYLVAKKKSSVEA